MNAAAFTLQSKNSEPEAFIEVNSAGQFVIGGKLNFITVPPLYFRGCQLIGASPLPIFDLKLVTSSDNAGLALVVAWIRYAKNLRKTVKFINMPQQLLAIAQVSGLEKIIVINGQNKNREK